MPSYTYEYTSISAWMVMAGNRLDVTSLNCQFTLNNVPMASVVLAVGYNATDGKDGPGIDFVVAASQRVPAQIYVSLDGVEHKVFDGYVAGTSLERTNASLGIRISIVHWSDNLRATSALTDDRTPAAYWDIQAPLTLESTGSSRPFFGLQHLMVGVLDASSNNFGAMIANLATSVADGGQMGLGDNAVELDNDEILASFTKMFHLLQFKFPVTSTPSVNSNVAQALASAFYTVFGGGNMWESFLRLARSFLFVIVPGVDTVLFYPHTPVLQTAGIELTDDDYVYITNTSIVRRLMRALILYDKRGTESNPDVVTSNIVSIFYVDPEAKTGLIDAAPLPAWLVNAVNLTDAEKSYVLDSGLGIKSRGTAVTVGDPDEDSTASGNKARNDDALVRTEVGTAYAQHVFVHRMFGKNQATIRTPLRFDIGPGTNISLSGRTYGYVTAVAISVDAERANASSTIMLSHTRSAGDNTKYALTGNPVFTGFLDTFNWVTGVRTIGGNK